MNLLKNLESEAIYIIREVVAQCERPVLLFSGGKDSMCLLHLAKKALWPTRIPFPVLHVDTGHNFPEVLDFRDRMAREYGVSLLVRKVEDSIRAGKASEDPSGSRNAIQSVTLVDAIKEFEFDAVFGGARREEEKARAKERIFSFRNEFAQWDPKNQRIEVAHLYNAGVRHGQHMRVFPLSNWTELDIWHYIAREKIQLPSLYFSHDRACVTKGDQLIPVSPFLRAIQDLVSDNVRVRFRTVGDMTCTAAVRSEASDISSIIRELLVTDCSERASRIDDAFSETSMEERKLKGYF